jgi:hypothetical protein
MALWDVASDVRHRDRGRAAGAPGPSRLAAPVRYLRVPRVPAPARQGGLVMAAKDADVLRAALKRSSMEYLWRDRDRWKTAALTLYDAVQQCDRFMDARVLDAMGQEIFLEQHGKCHCFNDPQTREAWERLRDVSRDMSAEFKSLVWEHYEILKELCPSCVTRTAEN